MSPTDQVGWTDKQQSVMAPDNIWSQSLFYNKIYIEILTDAPSSFPMENGLFTNNELKYYAFNT